MSTLKVNAITDASGGNTATINSMTPTADSLQGFRNRIINGDMRIDQRNAGASVTVNSGANFYGVDRFNCTGEATDGVFTVQRSTNAPAGFINSLVSTVTTADASIGAAQRYLIQQRIEGFNVADLGWGAVGAATVTLSFWVRSSVTGTFGGSLRNAAGNRSYPFTYSISSANTWEQKSITIAGDTTGTWATDNTSGIFVSWSLGSGSSLKTTAGAWTAGSYWAGTGSVDLISTLNATFYITGVQLEVGSVATPFERRPYGTELALCQRYYETFALLTTSIIGNATATTLAAAPFSWKVTKRATPTITLPTSGQASGNVTFLTSNGGFPSTTGTNTADEISVDKATVVGASYVGLTASSISIFWSNGASTIRISAEL